MYFSLIFKSGGLPISQPIPLEKLIQKLHDVLILHEEILLAYLYGTYVDGGWKSTSDIDVGIVVSPSALSDHWYSIKIKNEIDDALEENDLFDVRILNDRSPEFQFNVIFNHPHILVRDEKSRLEFECKIIEFQIRSLNEEIQNILEKWHYRSSNSFIDDARDGSLKNAEMDAILLRQLIYDRDELIKKKIE